MQAAHDNFQETNCSLVEPRAKSCPMKKITAFTITFIALLFSTNFALAAVLPTAPAPANLNPQVELGVSPDGSSNFRKAVLNGEKLCWNLRCAQSGVETQVFGAQSLTRLGGDLLEDLTAQAKDLAQDEWPDSIMEGPYVSFFNITIQEITTISQNGKALGYRLVIQDPAWQIDGCHYEPREPATLAACKPGRFEQVIFISVSLREAFHDPQTEVQFLPR